MVMVKDITSADDNPPNDNAQPPLAPAANATIQYNIQLNMLILLREIKEERKEGPEDRGVPRGRGGREDDRSGNCYTLDNANFARRNKYLYCWTHRGFNQISGDCTCKAHGHKKDATKAN